MLNSAKDDMIKINCFYYSFYIKKSELHKYGLTEEHVINTGETSVTNKKPDTSKKNSICLDFNNTFDSFSNILTKYKKNRNYVKVSEKRVCISSYKIFNFFPKLNMKLY
tara:strand:- start:701 stop:1027 length:327 start_codon:yes stop_codon:yes gene_type:complete